MTGHEKCVPDLQPIFTLTVGPDHNEMKNATRHLFWVFLVNERKKSWIDSLLILDCFHERFLPRTSFLQSCGCYSNTPRHREGVEGRAGEAGSWLAASRSAGSVQTDKRMKTGGGKGGGQSVLEVKIFLHPWREHWNVVQPVNSKSEGFLLTVGFSTFFIICPSRGLFAKAPWILVSSSSCRCPRPPNQCTATHLASIVLEVEPAVHPPHPKLLCIAIRLRGQIRISLQWIVNLKIKKKLESAHCKLEKNTEN